MIIVHIIGGLGNQMFQYAFGYAMAKRKNTSLFMDISGFDSYELRQYELNKFKIHGRFATKKEISKLKYKDESFFEKILRKMKGIALPYADTFYQEAHFHFDTGVFDTNTNTYFEGYWQSEKYFIECKEELLEQFTPKSQLHPDVLKLKQNIESTESVSLHIRRGDYVTNAHTSSVHGTCSLDYYQQAVALLEKKIDNPCFYIFSDDLMWAKDHLGFIQNIVFIEFGDDVLDYEEMYLMSQCKHNIIANSSFSWWGAWLNRNQDKTVIAPKAWFQTDLYNTKDLFPSSWAVI